MRPTTRTRTWRVQALASLAIVLAACGSDVSSDLPSVAPPASSSPSAPPTVAVEPSVEPAPSSASTVYAPNPGAIVVAIDAGHGGCLDWGVPDPSERGQAYAEETMTLAIAQRLRDLLEADGIGVVMIRDADEALAGDFAPDFGCDGPPFRDVDGDGNAGFEETGRFRTRDELQARIDRGNLAAADAFVSIHINSPTEGDRVIEIAFGQTFYDDETPWGEESARLADAVQRGTVDAIDPLTTYTRQNRGTEAIAYYAISRAWQDGDACEREGDTHCKPQRGLLMPSALAEVGSISLRAEHDLLVSAEGQAAVAAGLLDGLATYFDGRELAGRIALADAPIGATPEAITGDGPPFWPVVVPGGALELRVTNTGTAAWPEGVVLVAGWESTDEPYLARAPDGLAPLDAEIPALAPGESVLIAVELARPAGRERAVAWISLMDESATLADRGSPALQLATRRLP